MRIRMILAGAAIAVLGVTGVAYGQAPGVTTTTSITATTSPSRAGTPANPRNGNLNVVVGTRNSDGSQPPVVSRARVFFDRWFRFAPAAWPNCSVATLDGGGKAACIRRGAQVGNGSATAQVGTTRVPTTVTAFDGPGSTKFELFIEASRPIRIAQTIEGTLRRGSGRYGSILDVPIPERIQQPVPGLFSSLIEFRTNIFNRTRRIAGRSQSYVRLAGCTNRRLNFRYEVTLRRTTTPPSQGGTKSDTSTYPCRPAS